MLWMGLFTATLYTVVQSQTYSNDELEKFLLDAIQGNDTYDDIDFGDSKQKPCEPFVTEMPDYKMTGRRISETKCLEYIWEMEKRDKEQQWGNRCRIYLVSQIKKGIFPEIYFIVNYSVIFGGRAALKGEFPHMGAVGWRSKSGSPEWLFKCGSTLISENFALTAGHCAILSLRHSRDIQSPKPEIIRFGVENIADDEFTINGNPTDVKIKRIIRHPSYAPPKKYFDIALIELESVVQFKDNLQPACLWPYSDISHLGTEATLTGWGYTEAGEQSTNLQTVVVDIIENSKCDSILKTFRNRNWDGFRETQLCAGKLVGGVDTCQGDSGGPLQIKVPLKTYGNMYQILGVTSFGIKCGQKNRPGVYTRVSSFIDWIEETVWGHQVQDTASETI
ncbi:jg12974 [Pararge aegeria aegeria]|uniref:Jg12974 protein n=2 Tax=Pararge aegeria TaxID=116150 RepID=A0A8S4RV27_9NEOP|nr:jg12974 [Pararge aegeria aegeria]